MATDSAVIAVAEQPNRLSAIRRELAPVVRVPGSLSAGELVHMALFRYAKSLHDPASLLRWLAATQFHIDVNVNELLVVRELVFPSLNYEILHTLVLPPADSA